MLWMYQKVMFGKITASENQSLMDIGRRETIILLLIALFIFWIGLYPSFFLEKTEASIQHFVTHWKNYTIEIAP